MSQVLVSQANPGVTASRRRAAAALLLLVPAPTIGAASMLFWLPGVEGKVVSMLLKVWLLVLPMAWTLWVDRDRPNLGLRTVGGRRGFIEAVGSGLLIFALMLGLYFLVAAPMIDGNALRAKVAEVQFDTVPAFLAMFAYIIVVNALVEEYVWRWFVFRKCETLTGPVAGVVLSAALFTVHHVVALAAWVDWRLNILCSLGVFIGGLTWSWLFLRHRSVWPCYISHVFADLAIFLVAWRIVFQG